MKAPAKLARSAGVSPAQVRPSKPPGSECCVRRRRRRTRSVHSGCVPSTMRTGFSRGRRDEFHREKCNHYKANTGFECTEVVPTSPSDRARGRPHLVARSSRRVLGNSRRNWQQARACWQGAEDITHPIGHETGWTTARSLGEVGTTSVHSKPICLCSDCTFLDEIHRAALLEKKG